MEEVHHAVGDEAGDHEPEVAPESPRGDRYKGAGAFVAPYVDVGRRFQRSEVGLYVKQVSIFGEKPRGGISDFSSLFAGIRFAIRL